MNKLITYAYFIKETDVSKVVDNDKIDNYIKKSSERLRALITPSFYDQLVAQYSTNPQSFSADNLAFYDPYVKQYLAWQAYEFYIIKANTYETRMGVRTFKEENSDPATDKIMGDQIALAKADAEFYKNQMIGFLRTAQRVDSSKYPLYTIKNCQPATGGFGISAVSKIDTVNFSINRQISQDYLNDKL